MSDRLTHMPRQTARQAGSLLVESSLASHSAETTPQLVGAPEAHLSDFPTGPESVPTLFPWAEMQGLRNKVQKAWHKVQFVCNGIYFVYKINFVCIASSSPSPSFSSLLWNPFLLAASSGCNCESDWVGHALTECARRNETERKETE